MLARIGIMSKASASGGSSYDTNAEAYFNAVVGGGITVSDPHKGYLSDFYEAVKAAGVYTKLKGMGFWPWASANGNKFDMINPATLATFSNSPSQGSNGITFSGSQYADIKIKPNAASQNSLTIGVYVQTVSNTNSAIIGARDGSTFSCATIFVGGSSTAVFYAANRTGITSGTVSGVTGLLSVSRTASNLTTFYRGGTSQFTGNSASSTPANLNMFVGAWNDGAVGGESSHFAGRVSFWYVADGLTSTEIADLNTAVEALHDNFGIGVQ